MITPQAVRRNRINIPIGIEYTQRKQYMYIGTYNTFNVNQQMNILRIVIEFYECECIQGSA